MEKIPLLSDIPVLGQLLFSYDITVYMALLLTVLVWYFLYRTTWAKRIAPSVKTQAQPRLLA